MSVGRRSRPSAGIPAAIAPEHTSATTCPSARASATSRAQLPSATPSSSPRASVIDDVPTLTTSAHVRSLLGTRARPDRSARCHPRGRRHGERPLHTHAPEPLVDVAERLLVGEVGHRDDPLGGPPLTRQRAVVVAHDDEALLDRAVHDEHLGRLLHRTRLVDQLGEPTEERVEARVGHRRARACRRTSTSSGATSALLPITSRGRSSRSGW